MRGLGPRAQWVLASVLVPAFALAAGAAFWLQARSHAELESAFQRELGLLVQLPRLREDARRLEEATAQYLQSGDPRQLDARRRALVDLRRLSAGLTSAASDATEKALIDRLGRELASVLSEQEQWIARRAQGRLPGGAAVRLSSLEDGIAPVMAVLIDLKDANRARLDERRRRMERSGRTALALLLAAGALCGGFSAVFLSRRLSEAVELGKMKTQLVAMVSHEFNNSLSVLGGIARLLKADEPPDPRRQNYYLIIESNIRSLAVAARTLLELGRQEAGRLKVHPVRMDLAALARDSSGRLEVLWSRKGQTVAVEAPAGPVWVRGDPDALALVATNLVANAVKYTPEKGSITVAVTPAPAPGGGRFSVSDTGIGIAPEDQERILSGYYRTEAGKKAAKGFGVGLALSQALLSAHGAELKVESAPGQGARFSFELAAPAG